MCHFVPRNKPEFDPDDATSDKSWARKLREDKLNWHGGIKMRQTYLTMKVSLSNGYKNSSHRKAQKNGFFVLSKIFLLIHAAKTHQTRHFVRFAAFLRHRSLWRFFFCQL